MFWDTFPLVDGSARTQLLPGFRLAASNARSGRRGSLTFVVGLPLVLVRLWRYDDTIKLGGDQLLQCIEEG